MNSGLNLNSIKKYINNELKFVLFKLFPLGISLITINYVIINTYYYFKYKNFIFTKDEELLISKRIQHTMKNKLFETTPKVLPKKKIPDNKNIVQASK